MKKIVSVFATALLLSVAGIASASADTKSDYQAARATYKAAIVTYKTAVTNAHTAIESARATFKSARDAATTKEAKAAAKATFESAKTAAKAGIPTKPVKPVKPAQPQKAKYKKSIPPEKKMGTKGQRNLVLLLVEKTM